MNSISIVVPAYNEARRLPSTLDTLTRYVEAHRFGFAEILVVDDGSTDDTAAVAGRPGVRLLRNPGNRGKGYSVRHGMLEARGEWILFTDADLSAIEGRAAGRGGAGPDGRKWPSAPAPSTAR